MTRTGQGAKVTADMALVESIIMERYAQGGPRELVEQQALRFTVAAELLWGHMQTSKEAFEKGIRAWGWLAGCAVRAWRDHAALGQPGEDAISAAHVLESLKGKHDHGA